jgi:hypothetical protein
MNDVIPQLLSFISDSSLEAADMKLSIYLKSDGEWAKMCLKSFVEVSFKRRCYNYITSLKGSLS